jgi:hypothetical protein
MVRETHDDLRGIAKRLLPACGGSGRRSPLFRWLYARADAFQKLLEDTNPSWVSVAEALAAKGLLDGWGKHPTAERVRLTWFAVRRVKTQAPESRETRTVPVPSPTPAHLEPAPRPLLAPAAENDDDPLAAIRREMGERSGRKT